MSMPHTDRLPPCWTKKRFKYLAEVVKGRLPSSTGTRVSKADVAPYLSMEYLRGEINEPELVIVGPELVQANSKDILILWDGANAGEFLRSKRGVVSSTVAKVIPHRINDSFLYWACKGQEDFVRSETTGMGIPHVNGQSLANIRVPVPDESEQRAIAGYLDRETARLDALVAAKERLLELLAEKRQALITQAVTRGLDPNASLKPSGVEWLGDVPAHWEVRRIRTVTSIRNGATPSTNNEAYWNGDILWITPEDLGSMKGRRITSSERKITRAGYESCGTSLVGPNSIAISTRAPIGHLGILGLAGCVNQGCKLLVPKDSIRSDFLYYVLEAARLELQSRGHGATFTELSRLKLGSFPLTVPPLVDQTAISDYLDKETALLDTLAAKTRETVTLLKERRAALIAAAVTGKIDVGGCA